MADDEISQKLPVFKPSGQGAGKDLVGLQHQKIMAEGWWAGQFKQKYLAFAGTRYVDGIHVYNTNVNIGKRAKVREPKAVDFLEAIGMSTHDIYKLGRAYANDGVSKIKFRWTPKFKYEENDFKAILEHVINAIPLFDKIVVTNTFDAKHEAPWVEKPMYKRDFRQSFASIKDRKRHVVSINDAKMMIYDKAGNDLNDTLKSYEYDAIATLVMRSGPAFLELESTTHTIAPYQTTHFTPASGGHFGTGPKLEDVIYAKVTTTETYKQPLQTAIDGKFNDYKMKEIPFFSGCSVCGDGDTIESAGFAQPFWDFRVESMMYTKNENDALFYSKTRSFTVGKMKIRGTYYMRVDGLDNTGAKDLMEALGTYADFDVRKKKKSGFSKFVGRLTKFVGKALKLISLVSYYMPTVRVQMQAIMWGLNGGKSWGISKQDYLQQASIIIMTAFGTAVTIASMGSAGPAMKAFHAAMAAYGIYNGVESIEEMKESAEYQKELAKLDEAQKKLVEDALEEENMSTEVDEGGIDDSIFMPLDRDMREMETPMFAEGSELQLKFTEGIT